MQILTRPQRQALKRVFDRARQSNPDLPYRAFRRTAQSTIGCDGAIVVPFCNMWLAIERDGYTHS